MIVSSFKFTIIQLLYHIYNFSSNNNFNINKFLLTNKIYAEVLEKKDYATQGCKIFCLDKADIFLPMQVYIAIAV